MLDYAAVEANIGFGRRLTGPGQQLLDPYKMHAAVVVGKLYNEVTAEQRRAAKARLFGMMYGKAGLQVPAGRDLLTIYTAEQKAELCKAFNTDEAGLYDAIRNFFRPGVADAKT